MTLIQTVTGTLEPESVLCADAHSHLWLAPEVNSNPSLTDESAAVRELIDFRQSGGNLVLDCQPGGAGRNGTMLAKLSRLTGVSIVASTGYHLPKYYSECQRPWTMPAERFMDQMITELRQGLSEDRSVRAGAIKAAWTGSGEHERDLISAAVAVSLETGAGLTIHTEGGAAVEELVTHLSRCGAETSRVQLSHLDKRPDRDLHRDLAQSGYILGYDTFLRPKYEPERNVWSLLQFMLDADLTRSVAVGLDLVSVSDWRSRGGRGLREIPLEIGPRLRDMGAEEEVVQAMTGGNIARILAADAQAHETAA